jgi:hypothetical protein
MRTMLWFVAGAIFLIVAIFAGVLAFDAPAKPVPLASVSDPFATVEYADLPAFQRYGARDGAGLAYRGL